MGRELRRVKADWEHPKDSQNYIPLHGGSFAKAVADWDKRAAEFVPTADCPTYDEYDGPRPIAEDYMPDWPEAERTHFQMYEDCTEGTPISPVFATIEELCRWLADNGASSFGNMTATYEQWMATCKAGSAPSMIIQDGVIRSGVAHSEDL